MIETQKSLEETGVRAKSNQQLLKPHHKQAKKVIMSISFSALLFYIIFISISLLNISPSILLFKDTKFWFFISNAIVIIIAADSGAFSSSRKGNHDLSEEFMLNSKTRNTTSSSSSSFIAKLTTKTAGLEKKPMILLDSETSINYDKPMIFHKTNLEAHHDDVHKGNVQEEKIIELGDRGHIAARYDKRTKPRYNRSNSEKSITDVSNEDKRVLARSKTENYEDKFEEEDDEFSAMSDEELNKRVEEFIERFNRQIRLQESTL